MVQLENKILVDARNIASIRDHLMKLASHQGFVGFDIESSNHNCHEGLKKLLKMTEDGYSKSKKLVFDYARTVLCGASFYFGSIEANSAYYLNFGHSDVDNRIPVAICLEILEAIRDAGSTLIIHNASFELAVFLGSLNYELPPTLCSMQLCVAAYNPDTYNPANLPAAVANGIKPLIPAIERMFAQYDPKEELSFKQWEVLNKFVSKQGDASHSYNGIVKSISYGYALKTAVKSWFNFQMETYEQCLQGAPDMASISGEQVLSYGIDDAYWCYQLFMTIYKQLSSTNPAAVKTYIDHENPMTREYARATIAGMRVNLPEIYTVREAMRKRVAEILLDMKKVLRVEFEKDNGVRPMHEKLLKYEKWYKPESHEKYHNLLKRWLNSPDDLDDFHTCTQVKNATGNAWADDLNKKITADLSINHYMAMRYVLFVLCGIEPKLEQGKVQSDKDARAEMGDHPILKCYADFGTIEQAMKLYNTPYIYMTDPDTEKMHPVMSSLLATRRTACQNPNTQQLAKFGDSKYVRGYFLADKEDHLIISADWSAVELVMWGEFSKDPVFAKAYGQRPHADLHTESASAVMGISVAELKALPNFKELRTTRGKAASFEFPYSGWLANTGKKLGWTYEETKAAVDGFTEKFAQGVQWRNDVIGDVAAKGVVQLPDGQTRIRYEATEAWYMQMLEVFRSYGSDAIENFGKAAIRKIQKRAFNQAVNAMIQGSCGTLAKRTILNTQADLKKTDLDARFMLLIHDELLYSVQKDDVLEFSKFLYEHMINGYGLMQDLKLDSSLAIGYTFQAFDPEKAPYGQIELSEMPKGLPCIPEERWGQRATDAEIKTIVEYLTNRV